MIDGILQPSDITDKSLICPDCGRIKAARPIETIVGRCGKWASGSMDAKENCNEFKRLNSHTHKLLYGCHEEAIGKSLCETWCGNTSLCPTAVLTEERKDE